LFNFVWCEIISFIIAIFICFNHGNTLRVVVLWLLFCESADSLGKRLHNAGFCGSYLHNDAFKHFDI
jgi:hypothetical protein